MKKKILFVILRFAKLFGGFRFARWVTAKDLRILCYHGAAVADEHAFRPGLFISPDVFTKRMQYLAEGHYPVLPLAEALKLMQENRLPACATVITIDDGWYGTYSVMAPVLAQHGFPAMLYVATYYVEKSTQVFNVAIGYAMWRSLEGTLDLTAVNEHLSGSYDLRVSEDREAAIEVLNAYANGLESAQDRQELFRRLCDVLRCDWKEIESKRLIAFMSLDEARELRRQGIDLQLHTHRHRLPDATYEELKGELTDNRNVLCKVTDDELVHLCYPSGHYTDWHLEQLNRLNVETATNTEPGFIRKNTGKLELTRFLDSDALTDLEFEAEMSGFFEIIRRCGYRI